MKDIQPECQANILPCLTCWEFAPSGLITQNDGVPVASRIRYLLFLLALQTLSGIIYLPHNDTTLLLQ